ncbi:tol-pal system protein YbgF [Candidatus Providencia siddallii]|uniref:Cell division coordinator CpoB n=1 Tax=Candidatus Providencia siddallii TaxID=1715285 RepID=A0ABM9NNF3_9GAMM
MNNNFRCFLIALLLLANIATNEVAIGKAQIYNISSTSILERISKIEEMIDYQSKLLFQIQQQLIDNQNDIDILRGQIQENEYKLNKFIANKENYRIQQEQLKKSELTDFTEQSNNKLLNSKSSLNLSKTSEKEHYNFVVELAINSRSEKEINKSIDELQNFIKIYPKSKYQANVNYWLGQLNYVKNKKDDAAFYFAIVVKNFPNSKKSSESLYKIGLIMQEKGFKDKAKIIYQHVLKQYPNSVGALLAKKKLNMF